MTVDGGEEYSVADMLPDAAQLFALMDDHTNLRDAHKVGGWTFVVSAVVFDCEPLKLSPRV